VIERLPRPAALEGGNFYDERAVFSTYMQHRPWSARCRGSPLRRSCDPRLAPDAPPRMRFGTTHSSRMSPLE
jgi:hypothetical protein